MALKVCRMISPHSSVTKALVIPPSSPSSIVPLQSISPRFASSLRKSPARFGAGMRRHSIAASGDGSVTENGSRRSSFQGGESFFRSVLGSMEKVYLKRNPTAKAILELVQSVGDDQICYDHLAFRTFGVDGYGIDSLSKLFLDYGYSKMDELRFPAKKLRAYWFSPPHVPASYSGSGVNGPLPRIFISELLVDQMSAQTQEIIKKYTRASGNGNKHAVLSSALGTLTWEKPLSTEFKQLATESEYAAWTLVNGYALNHVTISVHRLKSHLNSIEKLDEFLEEKGFKLSTEGGVVKVSPDGFLQQSSTVADSIQFEFSDGIVESVPCSYIEFAQRSVLPQFQDLPRNEIKEIHRRDGFEVGNADKIFESTSKVQLTRKTF